MNVITRNNFEKGFFWELYNDLERQFQDFLEYVPYLPGNENIYSFKLLNLLLSIGGHVDSAFKEMAHYPEFSGNEDCKEILKKINKNKTVSITLPLKAFEMEYKLSEKTVIFKRLPEREDITPFRPRDARAKSPKWWKLYNAVKHDVGINIKEANLITVRDALAGAFLLNVIHIPGTLRLHKYGVLKKGEFYEFERKFISPTSEMVDSWIKRKEKFEGSIATPIFIFDYNQ
jgi:hypothetical protein